VEGQHEIVQAQPLVIFEGILALYEQRFRDLMDLKIFVLTDDDVRLARRIQRDISERGRTIEDVLKQYNRFVKTAYDEFIKPTMRYADIIIPHGRSNTVAIDFVVSNLKNRVLLDEVTPSSPVRKFSEKQSFDTLKPNELQAALSRVLQFQLIKLEDE
jgi:uridine kinase